MALERLRESFPQFDYELVAWSEFDPESKQPVEKQPAVIAHNALFPQWAGRNLGDMMKIDWEKVPDFDLLFYSILHHARVSAKQDCSMDSRREAAHVAQ